MSDRLPTNDRSHLNKSLGRSTPWNSRFSLSTSRFLTLFPLLESLLQNTVFTGFYSPPSAKKLIFFEEMIKALTVLSAISAVSAQGAVWYGISPDDSVPGQVNLFEMTPQGQIIRGVATIVTRDDEYPKTGTLHCSWTTDMCWFATGVAGPYIQDAIIGVNRRTGTQVFRHEIPTGI